VLLFARIVRLEHTVVQQPRLAHCVQQELILLQDGAVAQLVQWARTRPQELGFALVVPLERTLGRWDQHRVCPVQLGNILLLVRQSVLIVWQVHMQEPQALSLARHVWQALIPMQALPHAPLAIQEHILVRELALAFYAQQEVIQELGLQPALFVPLAHIALQQAVLHAHHVQQVDMQVPQALYPAHYVLQDIMHLLQAQSLAQLVLWIPLHPPLAL
jgi:hypothetical protein